MAKVWLVVVNWRNASDTVACLASICAVADASVTGVVLVDNDSGDDSVPTLKRWMSDEGLLLKAVTVDASALGGARCVWRVQCDPMSIVFIEGTFNGGFASGNNIGLNYLTQYEEFDAAFLLNNDTVLASGAVTAMAARMEQAGAGMCGATVVYWRAPQRIQALGGARYWPWLGKARHIGVGSTLEAPRPAERTEAQLDYVLGAALMISRRCLEDIGLMDERYFLYFEEIDWAFRARRRGWRLAYAPDAVIYHKEGGSIGSSTVRVRRSYLSDYYLLRSRLAFTRKAYPHWLPTVLAYSTLQMLRNLAHGDLARVRVQWAALSGRAFTPVEART